MSNALQTTSYAPLSVDDDLEGLPPAPKRKPSPPLVFSSLLRLIRRHAFLLSVVFFAVITATVAVIVHLSYARDKQNPYFRIPPNGSGIALIGHSHRFDETDQKLKIEWEILGCGEYRLTTYPPVSRILGVVGCDTLDRAVDVYFTSAFRPTYSYDPGKFPLTPTGETRYVWDMVTFSRLHIVDYLDTNMAPFDVYSLSVLVFVIERATNKPMPIVTLTAGQAPNNFDVSSVEAEMTNNYTYNSGTGPTTISVNSRFAEITAKRSRFARALTICLFLINWALTTGSIYIMVLVVSGRVGINDAILFLPVTIVLTIPTLRILYPGSPPFGIFIDTFGFVPQMMTVAVCSIILVYFVAIPKPVSKRRTSCDDEGT